MAGNVDDSFLDIAAKQAAIRAQKEALKKGEIPKPPPFQQEPAPSQQKIVASPKRKKDDSSRPRDKAKKIRHDSQTLQNPPPLEKDASTQAGEEPRLGEWLVKKHGEGLSYGDVDVSNSFQHQLRAIPTAIRERESLSVATAASSVASAALHLLNWSATIAEKEKANMEHLALVVDENERRKTKIGRLGQQLTNMDLSHKNAVKDKEKLEGENKTLTARILDLEGQLKEKAHAMKDLEKISAMRMYVYGERIVFAYAKGNPSTARPNVPLPSATLAQRFMEAEDIDPLLEADWESNYEEKSLNVKADGPIDLDKDILDENPSSSKLASPDAPSFEEADPNFGDQFLQAGGAKPATESVEEEAAT